MPVLPLSGPRRWGQLVTGSSPARMSSRCVATESDLFVLGISEVKRSVFRSPFQRGVGLQDDYHDRQLRTMIHAGMPTPAWGARGSPKLAEVLTRSRERLRRASRARWRNARATSMLLTLIQAGEEGGRLPDSQQAARQLELLMEIRRS